MNIRGVLEKMIAARASDLHLKAGTPPVVRVDGILYTLEDAPPSAQELRDVCAQLLNDEQRLYFSTHNEIDFAFGVSGLARFRANIFMQRGTPALALRHVPVEVPAIEDLMLPAAVRELAFSPRGLILVTGRTGSGKSTTLAAMIDYLNRKDYGHILTIEDPIEFVHESKRSLINQREVHRDTLGFSEALRSALRQDPDVVLVGEMRDYETIETALLAAETGHLVFSTLHTLDATETINRIISIFPPHHQKQIRIQLGQVLKAVVSMRLVPRADGIGRVPAVEVMIITPYIRECIENKEKTKFIREQIALGTSQYGMQTFDQSLFQLYKSGLITLDEALRRASNPDEFKLKVQGVQFTADIAREQMEEAIQMPPEGEFLLSDSQFELEQG